MQLVAQVTNLFDRRYYTAGQLGPFGFTDTGSFIARPLPAIDGEFPVRHATFYAPGAPVRMWVGTDRNSDQEVSAQQANERVLHHLRALARRLLQSLAVHHGDFLLPF